MKLLMSAYACAPNRGSEHGVGWNWVTEAHRLGHDVWALASTSHRDAILAACRADPELAGINWRFPEVPGWQLEQGREPRWERTYNLLWQRAALRCAEALQRDVAFDAAHHITWGGIRAPTFLHHLGIPLIIGPLGGGETTPPALRDVLHLKARVTEWIRDVSNATNALNPIVRGGLRSARLVAARTSETQRVLDRGQPTRSVVFQELVLHAAQIGKGRAILTDSPRMLFAGRLLYWKGVHIALRALAELRLRRPNARLTIAGSGPELNRLQLDVERLKLAGNVEFIPWLPQEKLFRLYDAHDLFLFPSLHDSGGYVVLEALSRGLPVVCLDLGGPALFVTESAGVVIRTNGLRTQAVAAAIAAEIDRLCATPWRLAELSHGAVERAKDFIIDRRVASFYAAAAERLGIALSGDPRPPKTARVDPVPAA